MTKLKSEFFGQRKFYAVSAACRRDFCLKKLSSAHFENYSSFGGYDGAERKVFRVRRVRKKMIFRLLSLKFQRATKAFLNTEIISARCFRSELNAKK
ncbi:MAG: hypothetical protein L6V93_16395 [Clostridiales bacterium]|nr:MAG: hypothetical protein L6V93_16395 [Clostridiales bacterium]